MSFESLLLRLDRIAGGRAAGVRIDERDLQHPRTRRAFTWIMWLLLVELLLGVSAVVVALVLASGGEAVPFSVWMRTVIVLGMTATLFYFAWRASLGWRWAYQRLRLFAQIFPVITLVLAAIPGLYPAWMVTEQIVFSLLMIGIADFLTSDHMRAAFRRRDGAGDAASGAEGRA
jgi:hypothetical protein